MNSPSTAQQSNHHHATWRCGIVGMSEQGYESLEPADKEVILWLTSELLERLSSANSLSLGSHCYHLKDRGGIKKACRDLSSHLSSGRYRYIIRSDAKGYYAHIRHHKLIALLKDQGYSRDICHVVTQLCQRTTLRGGHYSECRQGIPLGCAASPALAAIYLSPLDHAMSQIPGVKYLRYMDDWVILCESRWKIRRAVKLMHQTLAELGLHAHPDKTYIGKVSKGFDFLGVDYPASTESAQLSPSQVAHERLAAYLYHKLHHASQLYEQGKLHSLESLEGYLNNWLRYLTGNVRPVLKYGIGVSVSAALQTLSDTLRDLMLICHDVMVSHFLSRLTKGVNQLLNSLYHETKKQNIIGSPRRARSLCSV